MSAARYKLCVVGVPTPITGNTLANVVAQATDLLLRHPGYKLAIFPSVDGRAKGVLRVESRDGQVATEWQPAPSNRYPEAPPWANDAARLVQSITNPQPLGG